MQFFLKQVTIKTVYFFQMSHQLFLSPLFNSDIPLSVQSLASNDFIIIRYTTQPTQSHRVVTFFFFNTKEMLRSQYIMIPVVCV